MKQMLTIMVIVSFLSVLFGSFMMTSHGSSHASICLATRLNGSEAPCPESNPIGFANFHGEALRKFSNLIIVDGSALLYAIALLGVVTFGFLSANLSERYLVKLAVISSLKSKAKSYPAQANRLNWFSLHENSPAYF